MRKHPFSVPGHSSSEDEFHARVTFMRMLEKLPEFISGVTNDSRVHHKDVGECWWIVTVFVIFVSRCSPILLPTVLRQCSHRHFSLIIYRKTDRSKSYAKLLLVALSFELSPVKVSVDRRMLCSNILEARIWLSEKAWSTDVLERRHGASVRNLLDRISKMRSSSINEKQAVKIEMIWKLKGFVIEIVGNQNSTNARLN